MAQLKQKYGAPLFSFGPHVSCTPEASMERAAGVDGMFVGEPEDGLLALAALSSMDGLDTIPSLTFRRNGASRRAQGARHASRDS